ncbi:hypothetical protein UA08_05633 [Talaromyces atroroseus]|uniref:Methyltransferase domain-containing protein n=1 Tax=Talaromyces atroroseus TaxID=1441469 RepID=A0A225AZP7_TALAT|nr:hypothetical protein UA08_05633 [Talaromyces atroroseus]OKL58997.1 hypothetical protein UA08_05633 [Talaromyces atroroseus]
MTSEGSRIQRLQDCGGPSKPQLQHRIEILKKWDLMPGSRILEIGCGQGDCTLVLADLVGEHGHITAIDPAPLDYGAPMTLGEAQSQLKSGPYGNRITFHQANLQDFLDSGASEPLYDYAIFVHSVWYLPSVETLQSMLLSLRGRAKQLLLAEYVLDIRGDIAALPHMIAAISQAEFNSRGEHSFDRNDNIQSIISPEMIRTAAVHAGWEFQREEITEAAEGLEDGRWEVGRVLSKEYLERSESCASKRRQEFANALIEAVKVSRRVLGPQPKVKTLPTWQCSWV